MRCKSCWLVSASIFTALSLPYSSEIGKPESQHQAMMNRLPNNRMPEIITIGRKANSITNGRKRVKRAAANPSAARNNAAMTASQHVPAISEASSTHKIGKRKRKTRFSPKAHRRERVGRFQSLRNAQPGRISSYRQSRKQVCTR